MRDAPGSSLTRMLGVFDLFSSDEAALTADQIVARLGYSRPTAYRYIRTLCGAGLLSRVAGRYALGPRIIELDFLIRRTDPMLQLSQPVIRELRDAAGCDVLLASMFGDRIIATHHERGAEHMPISFTRGRPMPLFRGAGSKAILSFLTPSRQRRLFEAYRHEAAAAGKTSWEALRADLRSVRRAGFAVSAGELDSGNVALAAPVFHDAPNPPGAVIVVLSTSRFSIADRTLLQRMIRTAAARITLALKQQCDPETQNLAFLPLRNAV